MDLPRISIVTPSYNQGKFLEDTILSVINQNYPNYEYIIMDGGSTDNTVEIIKKYEKKITYWESVKDKGQTHAINKGFKKATGEIIAWINSDDIYCNNVFHTIANFFLNNPNDHVVVGNGLFMDPNGKIYLRKHPHISPWLEKFSLMSIFQPSTFLKKTVLTEIGFLNEDYHMMMDAEWYYRIAQKYNFQTINKDISIFRYHPKSKSSSDKNSKLYQIYKKEHVALVKVIFPKLKVLIEIWPEIFRKAHTIIGQFIRLFQRCYKGDLYKIKDNNIEKSFIYKDTHELKD